MELKSDVAARTNSIVGKKYPPAEKYLTLKTNKERNRPNTIHTEVEQIVKAETRTEGYVIEIVLPKQIVY